MKPPRLAEPRLDGEHRCVRGRCSPGDAPCHLIHGTMPRKAGVRRIVEQRTNDAFPPGKPERGELAPVDLEKARRGERVPRRGSGESSRSGIRRIAPDAVALALTDRRAHTQDATGQQEHRSQAASVECDRRAGGSEVIVDERIHANPLLDPAVPVACPSGNQLGQLQRLGVVIDLLEPEEAFEPVVLVVDVERRGPPVVRRARTVDAQNDRLLGREGDALVVRVPDEPHLARLTPLPADVPGLPVDRGVARERGRRRRPRRPDDDERADGSSGEHGAHRGRPQDERDRKCRGERDGAGGDRLAAQERGRPADAGDRHRSCAERPARRDEERRWQPRNRRSRRGRARASPGSAQARTGRKTS